MFSNSMVKYLGAVPPKLLVFFCTPLMWLKESMDHAQTVIGHRENWYLMHT